MVNYYAGSPAALPAPQRQISGYPPASGSRTTLTWIPPCCLFLIDSFLSPYLACFLAHPVNCSRFRFAKSWIVGLVIGGAESRGAGADSFHLVLLVVARLKLWLILMACLHHLVSALTNTNDILKEPLLISYLGLKAVQSCRALNCYGSRLSTNFLSRTQGYPPSFQSFQNRFRRDQRQV